MAEEGVSHGRLCAKGCTPARLDFEHWGSQEDTTPRRIAVSPPVAALFVSNFPSCRLAPSPIRSGSIVIAVIVIVIRPGIMHNAGERAACVRGTSSHGGAASRPRIDRVFDLSFHQSPGTLTLRFLNRNIFFFLNRKCS